MPQLTRDNAVAGIPASLIYRQGGKRDAPLDLRVIPMTASVSLPAINEEFSEIPYAG
jgi:hypothetical protein